MTSFIDVRCDGIHPSGMRKGGPCLFLLLRIDPDTVGRMETKCPRCMKVKEWQLIGAAREYYG